MDKPLWGLRVQKVQKVQRVHKVQRVEVGALMGASINDALRQQEKQYNRPAGEEMQSPFGGWRHHLSAPLGSVSLDSQSPTAPCESSSLATAVRWGGKRKAP